MLKRRSPFFIGFLQAVGVAVYCTLVVLFMESFMPILHQTIGIFGAAVMLSLLVLSASITGSLVFGYPVYLVLLERNFKRALVVFGSTVFVLFVIIVTTAFLVTMIL